MTTAQTHVDPFAQPEANLVLAHWMTLLASGAMQAQRLQMQALVCWQTAMLQIGSEIWDEWRCRFAGGAPIDG